MEKSYDFLNEFRQKALLQIKLDAEKIYQLILLQLENLTLPQCPFYEDVLDTQIYGLSKEVNFAVTLELIDKEEGKKIIEFLEKQLTILFESSKSLSDRLNLNGKCE